MVMAKFGWSSGLRNKEVPGFNQTLLMKHQYQEPDPNRFAEVNFQGQTAIGVGNLKLQREKKESRMVRT